MELKPCPFCGSEAVLAHEPLFGSDSEERFWRVECVNQDCSMGNPDALHSDRQGLINEWNTRHQDDEVRRLTRVVQSIMRASGNYGYWLKESFKAQVEDVHKIAAEALSSTPEPKEGSHE